MRLMDEGTTVRPLISVVIPTYIRVDLLKSCINSLLEQKVCELQVIVVDNASPACIADEVDSLFGRRVTTIRLERNYFYCGAVNRGFAHATGEIVAVLNDDCHVAPDWALHLLETFEEFHDAGSVAS